MFLTVRIKLAEHFLSFSCNFFCCNLLLRFTEVRVLVHHQEHVAHLLPSQGAGPISVIDQELPPQFVSLLAGALGTEK